MILKGFENLEKTSLAKTLKKANSVSKAPSIRRGGLFYRIKEAEKLAETRLGKFKDEYKCLVTEEQVEHYLFDDMPKNSFIALDTETAPKDLLKGKKDDAVDYQRGHIIGICLTKYNNESVYIPVNHIDPVLNQRIVHQVSPEFITKIFNKFLKERSDIKFDYHNAEFDIRMMIHTFDVNLIDHFNWDTMIVEHLINENRDNSHALKKMDKKYYPEDYKGIGEENIEVTEFSDLFGDVPFAYINPEFAKLYAAGDTFKTKRVKEAQIKWLSQKGNEKLYKRVLETELPIVPVTIRCEERGIYVDLDYVNKLEEKYKNITEEAQRQCYKELEPYKDLINTYHKTVKGKDKLDDPIKLSSPEQINILLYDILKLSVPEDEISNDFDDDDESESKESTDVGTFIKLMRKYKHLKKFLKTLLEYRHAEKMNSTYIKAIKDRLWPDSRIRCTFNPAGTVTGRFASKNPNMQNVPSNAEFRNMFTGGDKFYIAGGDFSKQEVFLTVEECQDETLAEVFHKGLDIYSVLASTITGYPYKECVEFEVEDDLVTKKLDKNGNEIENHDGKKRRKSGKSGWLGITYGLGASSLAERSNQDKKAENDKKLEKGIDLTKDDLKMMTKEEAQFILDKIHSGYPITSKWIEDTHKFAETHGYVENMYGRRRNLSILLQPDYTIALKAIFKNKKAKTKKIIGYEKPTCLEIDPMDWKLTNENSFTIDDVPKEIYEPYISQLNNPKLSYTKRQQIINHLENEENLKVMSNQQEKAKALRQSVNSKIQGGAGVLIKQVMINIDKDEYLRAHNVGLICTIHDEVLVEVPKDDYEECSRRVRNIMIDTAEEMVKLVDVKVDAVCATCWYGEKTGHQIHVDW